MSDFQTIACVIAFKHFQALPSLMSLSENASLIASKFVLRFYKTLDSQNIVAIEQLYSPDARIAWNGTPLQVGPPLRDFYARMPAVATQVEVVDAHPLPVMGAAPLQIAITVTGKQSFFDPRSSEKLLNRPGQSLPAGKKHTSMSEDQIEQLPRVFNQSFIVAPARNQAGAIVLNVENEPIYVARSDCYRFVG